MVVIAPDWGDVVLMSRAIRGMGEAVADEDAIRMCVEKLSAGRGAFGTLFNVAGANRRGLAEDYTARDRDSINRNNRSFALRVARPRFCG
jgi:hypothetical protein